MTPVYFILSSKKRGRVFFWQNWVYLDLSQAFLKMNILEAHTAPLFLLRLRCVLYQRLLSETQPGSPPFGWRGSFSEGRKLMQIAKFCESGCTNFFYVSLTASD